MANVPSTSFVVRTFALVMTGLPIAAFGQELWPGMETYVQTSTGVVPQHLEGVALTNLYDSALVAASWRLICGGEPDGRIGSTDVAETYADPWEKGQTLSTTNPDVGCHVVVDALIFADGTELGDAAALSRFHQFRAALRKEIHRTLAADVLKSGVGKWSPEDSVDKLRGLLGGLPSVTYERDDDPERYKVSNHRGAVETLLQSMTSYLAAIQADPGNRLRRQIMYVKFLQEWENALSEPIYSSKRTWWNR